eukprot:CAMPEP_0198135344 /NCGR_PEP_ID=MMETSP1442-20131203/60540_1 /TAXON_ID= /ORGANISM="Craspedostauros australis, Strain CCMP3328" /LENGTH=110 /DNA_ID=CAMNT_0043796509 /DNA_START=275 /DNA_END=607 /DNA_ORIENTATION=-
MKRFITCGMLGGKYSAVNAQQKQCEWTTEETMGNHHASVWPKIHHGTNTHPTCLCTMRAPTRAIRLTCQATHLPSKSPAKQITLSIDQLVPTYLPAKQSMDSTLPHSTDQ